MEQFDTYWVKTSTEGDPAAISSKTKAKLPKVKSVKQVQISNAPKALGVKDITKKLKRADKDGWFSEPVNVELVPSYLDFIKTPMDLGTVERKLSEGLYKTVEDWAQDVRLIWENCRTFNIEDDNPIRIKGDELSALFEELYETAQNPSGNVAEGQEVIPVGFLEASLAEINFRAEQRIQSKRKIGEPSVASVPITVSVLASAPAAPPPAKKAKIERPPTAPTAPPKAVISVGKVPISAAIIPEAPRLPPTSSSRVPLSSCERELLLQYYREHLSRYCRTLGEYSEDRQLQSISLTISNHALAKNRDRVVLQWRRQ
jgi:hypothetical protein